MAITRSRSLIPAGLLLTWLIQSTVLLAVGLLAGHLLRKRGPAIQSALYRTTLGASFSAPSLRCRWPRWDSAVC